MEEEEPGSERNVAPKWTAYRGMMLAKAGRSVKDGMNLDDDGRLPREALYQRGALYHPNEELHYNGHDSDDDDDDDDDDDEEKEEEEANESDHQTPMVATRGPTRNNSNNGGSSAAAAARDVLRGMRTRSGSLLRDAPRPRAVPPELVQGTIDDKDEPEQEDGVAGAPPDGDTGGRRRLFTSPSLRGRDAEEDPAAASKYISESTRKRIIAKRMRYRGFESLDYSIYRYGHEARARFELPSREAAAHAIEFSPFTSSPHFRINSVIMTCFRSTESVASVAMTNLDAGRAGARMARDYAPTCTGTSTNRDTMCTFPAARLWLGGRF